MIILEILVGTLNPSSTKRPVYCTNNNNNNNNNNRLQLGYHPVAVVILRVHKCEKK